MDSMFKNKKFNAARALQYGFVRRGVGYFYATKIMHGKFELQISVSGRGKCSDVLIDTAFGDEYILHRVDVGGGAYVERVRAAYETAMESVMKNCFDVDVFTSPQSRRVIEYVRKRYGTQMEYLWKKFPENAVMRRADNNKWYGAMLTVPHNRIEGHGTDRLEILDLRGDVGMVDNKVIFPGWHMNKKSWITVPLDGRVGLRTIYRLIDDSFKTAG